MALGNDTRGWIMAVVSGVACVLGASIICVDLIIQQVPGKRNFRIQDSSYFLSASLSLSSGVMLFSSLYNMLPTSNSYLKHSGQNASAAGYTMMGSFLGGVVVIQIVSVILHRFMPSHIVDCDHSHSHDSSPDHEHLNGGEASLYKTPSHASESTPLLQEPEGRSPIARDNTDSNQSDASTLVLPRANQNGRPRRPSLHASISQRVTSFISGDKAECDDSGPCYGFSHPCGQECYKHVRNASYRSISNSTGHRSCSRKLSIKSVRSGLSQVGEESNSISDHDTSHHHHSHDHANHTHNNIPKIQAEGTAQSESEATGTHHHHVPKNAFMSIGLQTLIAIALHKMPEGFITFATNHANPTLGFAVFMALFIHNLTEGFVMALPLYLALSSRWRAILYSSILGGVTQPLGAGVAAAWFKIAGRSDMTPGDGVYGVMFAVTAGVMTSVALQLFSESVALYHNRMLCVAFAFIGMGILGFSSALTAAH